MISLSRVFEPSNWKTSSAFRAHNTISLGKSWVNSVAKQEWKTGRSMNQEHNWIYQLSKALLLQFQPLLIKKTLQCQRKKSKEQGSMDRCVMCARNRYTWNLISLESICSWAFLDHWESAAYSAIKEHFHTRAYNFSHPPTKKKQQQPGKQPQ